MNYNRRKRRPRRPEAEKYPPQYKGERSVYRVEAIMLYFLLNMYTCTWIWWWLWYLYTLQHNDERSVDRLSAIISYILCNIRMRNQICRQVVSYHVMSVLKLIEIVILWVYYTIPFGLSVFRDFLALFCNFFNYFRWLRITDEGWIPEMRIRSILLIKSDLKWYIHLSRSLYLYFNYLVSVTAGGPRSPRGHM